jgi:pentose-5-phosphate-3-epimerase
MMREYHVRICVDDTALFGGAIGEMLPKILRLRAMCAERGLRPVIEVDGGENATTAAEAATAGATAIGGHSAHLVQRAPRD